MCDRKGVIITSTNTLFIIAIVDNWYVIFFQCKIFYCAAHELNHQMLLKCNSVLSEVKLYHYKGLYLYLIL